MSRKKIFFSIYDDLSNPYYAGGGARVVYEVARRLTSEFDVTVITGAYTGAVDRVVEGVSFQYIGVTWFGPQISQFLFHFFLVLRVVRADFDVWVETFTPPFSTSFIPLFTRKPVIGFVQMLSGEDMMRKYKIPFYLIERFGLRFYSRFVVLTDYFVTKIKKYSPHATFAVIPNGVDLHPYSEENEGYILALGRIEVDQKGLDLLIDAYSKLAHKELVPLVIAGGGTEREVALLKKIIVDRGLEKFIRYAGRVGGAAKEDLYKKALCIAITSRFDTFNLVALEGLSYGKPLVYFALDTLQWIPQKAGIGVTPFDTERFAQALAEISANRELYHQMRLDAVQAASEFSWDSIARKHSLFLRGL
jgi:glycosyltransferase involved in cell wall biosynthesis